MKMSFLIHTQQIREAIQVALEGGVITGISKMYRLPIHGEPGMKLIITVDVIRPSDGQLLKDVVGFSLVVVLASQPGTFEIVAEKIGESILANGKEIDPSSMLIEFVEAEEIDEVWR